jgi:hypothetical protein
MSKSVYILTTTVILSIWGLIYLSNRQPTPKIASQNDNTQLTKEVTPIARATDVQASFAIFTNGTFRVFTAAMYHNLSSDVYIEASRPNVVKIKKTGVTWNDFFTTLPFSLTRECLITGTKETFCTGSNGKLQFYINGTKNSDVLNQEIQQGDKLLVTFGKESEDVIRRQFDRVP